MKSLVIIGSVSLDKEKINKWVDFWVDKGFKVINFPQAIGKKDFFKKYPRVYKEWYVDFTKTDVLFVANEDRKGIKGYLGAETFAELAFTVAQKLLLKKKTKIILAKRPSKAVQCFDEIALWNKLGWIEFLKK